MPPVKMNNETSRVSCLLAFKRPRAGGNKQKKERKREKGGVLTRGFELPVALRGARLLGREGAQKSIDGCAGGLSISRSLAR